MARIARRTALAAGASLSVTALAAAASVPALAGTQPAATPSRATISTVPAWEAAATPAVAPNATTSVAVKVWLGSRDSAGLAAVAKSVSDPKSPQFRHYLTSEQYVQRFAPTADTVAAVKSWLTQSGLTVGAVGADNHYVVASGSAVAIQQAFGTRLGTFVVNGQTVQAPTSDVTVPAALGSAVVDVTGLNTLNRIVKPADLGAPAAFVNSTQCSAWYGQHVASTLPKFNGKHLPYAVCGYTPNQLRDAYGVTFSRLTGKNQKVAITDAFDSPTLLADANTYATRHGDSAFGSGQFSDRSVAPDPTRVDACGGNGWFGEQTLDVEAVHGMAPAAGVAYYGAASCYDDDLMAALAQYTADNDASIVSNSWGEYTFVIINGKKYITIDKATVDAYESIFQQGAAQGQAFYFSSGDNGDELANTGVKYPDFPAEDPWVTAVGGTALAVGRQGGRNWETGWGTAKYTQTKGGRFWTESIPFQYGAGGGFATGLFPRPWYQSLSGLIPAGSPHGRAVPDIAMDADPTTGMLIGETQAFSQWTRFGPKGVHYGEYRIGGTSLASPLLAGAMAAAQQGLHARIGFANPAIYALAADAELNPFYDVKPTGDAGNVRADYINGLNTANGTIYSVRTFDQDSSLTTAPGWDDVTGVGSLSWKFFALVKQAGRG